VGLVADPHLVMKYDLVFEGGGAKGMVFAGAWSEFNKRGHSYDRLLGTSAGAITAALLAAGYGPQELLEALRDKGPSGKSVFTEFMGPPRPFSEQDILASATLRLLDGMDIPFFPNFAEKKLHEKLMLALAGNTSFCHLLGFVERGGWYSADGMVSWLKRKLDSGLWQKTARAFSGMTLQEFFLATNVELSVVASDTTDGAMLVLNHRTAPDCPVVWAVRMSMSIPLVWDEIIWAADWGQYRSREIAGHSIVDGGLLSNFPIELFISDAPHVTMLMGPKNNNPVLGLLIDENLPVAEGLPAPANTKIDELKSVQRLRRLANTLTGAHDKMIIEEYRHLVARLPAQGYGTTEFDMSDERRAALVNAGAEALAHYFDGQANAAFSKGVYSKAATQTAADRIATSLLERNQLH